MKTILARLKEPSSWVAGGGLVAMLAQFTTGDVNTVLTVLAAQGFVLGFGFPEKGDKE